MRTFRTVSPTGALGALLALGAFLLATEPAAACTVSSAHLIGRFDDSGRFVLKAGLDSRGNTLDGAAGLVFSEVTAAEGVDLTAAGASGAELFVIGDVDFGQRSLRVKSLTADAGRVAAVAARARKAGAPTAAASAGAGCSAEKASSTAARGSCCAGKAGSRATSASAKGCGAAARAGCSGAATTKASAAAPEVAGRRLVIAVSGMTCEGCAARVEAAVTSLGLEGVRACEVRWEEGTAIVTVAEDGDVDPQAIANAITEAGFPAKVKETASPASAKTG